MNNDINKTNNLFSSLNAFQLIVLAFIACSSLMYVLLHGLRIKLLEGLNIQTGLMPIDVLDLFTMDLQLTYQLSSLFITLTSILIPLIIFIFFNSQSVFSFLIKKFKKNEPLDNNTQKNKKKSSFIDRFFFRSLLLLIATYLFLFLNIGAYRFGSHLGEISALGITEDLRTGALKPTPTKLQDKEIDIYTIICNPNICLGIEILTDDNNKTLKTRAYESKYYINPLI